MKWPFSYAAAVSAACCDSAFSAQVLCAGLRFESRRFVVFPQYRHGFGVQDQWSGERQSRSGVCRPSAITFGSRGDEPVQLVDADESDLPEAPAPGDLGEVSGREPPGDGAEVDAGMSCGFSSGEMPSCVLHESTITLS